MVGTALRAFAHPTRLARAAGLVSGRSAAAQALQRVRDTRDVSYTAFTRTLKPSRGFGIGHICQSGL
ncbi:hypothetical protein ABIF65_008521 [Bradyrhizobium japonicum]|jgi:hypothetical protein|nr:hypothetical protein [Bradyrhizobium japonicum]MCP1774102.1 hypothetical protein [Bradyrhizobium japonicum]MCP1864329.1 hypothetical protein [Bradyrhizobium japonicum]MCP1894916.1 hypothetical protein [Bradyrhizobium japonicum]MCP1962898.1 hypothetical protein [Bradyrhizobium japonicum]